MDQTFVEFTLDFLSAHIWDVALGVLLMLLGVVSQALGECLTRGGER